MKSKENVPEEKLINIINIMSGMDKETFLENFITELDANSALYPYYKLNKGSSGTRLFRKSYFLQRLDYIESHIDSSHNPKILDCGCGYGTTCLFLAMNGLSTKGTTLEYYADLIENRKKYWAQFGNPELFSWSYENIFDNPPEPESYDYIILQDTLHHIEPVDEALPLFYKGLKKGGKLILIEINASCWLESFIFFLKRGNKRIINFYDERLKKSILIGNENFRTEKKWQSLFEKAGFSLDKQSVQYIRFFLPVFFNKKNYRNQLAREQKIASQYNFLKKYGFFGLNMVFTK